MFNMEVDYIRDCDCLDGMKTLPDGSIDLIFCDLPYGTTRAPWDCVIEPTELWKQYERIIKTNGAILLFGQDKFTARMMLSNSKLHRYNIIWEKTTPTGFLNARRMPMRSHEDIMVFYKHLPTYNPQKTEGHARKVSAAKHHVTAEQTTNYGKFHFTDYDSTERFPTSVWKFPTDRQKSAIHPQQKPLELCRYAIRTYSNKGDIVLDNCCGSGTIPLAAEIEDRHFIGMDNGMDERIGKSWAIIAAERINAARKG